jgi:hypothetical protein
MKNPFNRGFAWTQLYNKPSTAALENDTAPDIELTQRNDQGPIKTVATFDSFYFRSEAERLSPKRLEDDVAEKVQVDGWRFGASAAAITAGVTAVLTLSVAIWLTATSTAGGDTGDSKVIAELFNGNCAKAATMNTWTHLAINVVSTGLLAGSNFCSESSEPVPQISASNVASPFLTVQVQCLVAPNRADIDRAHAKGVWLDIGVPSIRNLRHISPLRSCLWALLALSSLPLHLLCVPSQGQPHAIADSLGLTLPFSRQSGTTRMTLSLRLLVTWTAIHSISPGLSPPRSFLHSLKTPTEFRLSICNRQTTSPGCPIRTASIHIQLTC